ncbi:polysaccharide export protein (plasmid) [Mesorhizobium sp. AR02]|uniref:polysaccharide biosynthesis/export family protein n=1 Tax=Mesorhizobium sp. AR02 TaxID=2865837 RepID=UPI00215F7498|nr:polysaccharide biosynthesis/export family protein [Mesorhizobium sp. AR02]UVK50239.1 polysaccharide export protein [Mesorhizobium sp. AR02]
MKKASHLLLLLPALLMGCVNLPASGPTASAVVNAQGKGADSALYEVVDITDATLAVLRNCPTGDLASQFSRHPPAPSQALTVGDQIVVTIFEAASGGLFSGSSTQGAPMGNSHSISLPQQTVDRDGSISVPYAGRITAAGRTPGSLAKAIEARLANKAVEPQVIVSTQGSAATATVSGDATGAARVPLSLKGDRLLEVIAQSGGIRTMPQETKVRLTRGALSEVTLLDTILKDPSQNVFVYPGDNIYVYRDPPIFVALGAVTAQKDYPIDKEPMSLLQAIAKAGGLQDAQADSSAIFLFRREGASLVRALKPTSTHLTGPDSVPVIYRLRLNKADNYFYAQQLAIRDRDIIYVANSPVVQFNKFVTMVRGITSTAGSLRGVAFAN